MGAREALEHDQQQCDALILDERRERALDEADIEKLNRGVAAIMMEV